MEISWDNKDQTAAQGQEGAWPELGSDSANEAIETSQEEVLKEEDEDDVREGSVDSNFDSVSGQSLSDQEEVAKERGGVQ